MSSRGVASIFPTEVIMVLRTFNLTIFDIAKWIAAIMTIATALWVPGVILASALWLSYGERAVDALGLASAEDINRLETTVADTSKTINVLARQITVLSQPENITVYREVPVPVEGYCIAGEPCAIGIFAERDIRAIDCRIISSQSEMIIIAGSREYVAVPPIGKAGTNLTSSPRALEPTFILPSGIPAGQARAIIRTSYEDCPWQINGEPPAIHDSPTFPLEIRQ